MLSERLKRARMSASLSLRAAAEIVGVSHSAIKKYEDGVVTPSSMQLINLAKAYDVRTEYFFRTLDIQLTEVEFRKRSNTPMRLLRKIESEVLDQVERWQELVNLYPNFPVKSFSPPKGLPTEINDLSEIEDFANHVRKKWELGFDPISDLVDALETVGIWVIFANTNSEDKFDGLMAYHGKQPVIVVSSNWSGDRQRFTLAHELGHILLHNRLAGLEEEKACNRFAGAFLLPKKNLLKHFGKKIHKIEPHELYLLKQEFGLSMAGCLYRLLDIGLISADIHRYQSIAFSKKGWRKKEPGEEIPAEKSFLFKQLVYRALAECWLSESKAAELLSISLSKFHNERKLL